MDARHAIGGLAAIGFALSACGAPTGLTVVEPLADAADVVCEPDGARVEPTVTRPRGDGIHLRVENPTDGERMLLIDTWGYEPAPPGVTDIVLTVPPGRLSVACMAPLEGDDPEELGWPYPAEDEWAALPILEVVDVEGLWADDTLACDFASGHHNDYPWEMTDTPIPEGRAGDPVKLARQDLPAEVGDIGAIRRGDVLEHAGYRDVSGRVRLVRDGKVVALVRYSPDGRGGWHFAAVEHCEEDELDGAEPTDVGEEFVDDEPAGVVDD